MASTLIDQLPENARVTVVSAPIIYFLEDHPRFAARFAPIFEAAEAGHLAIVVSTITLSEVMAGPLKAGNDVLAAQYLEVFRGSLNWEVMPVTEDVAVLAARIRVLRHLRLPDAIQVATAVVSGSVALVTRDVDFSSVTEIRILS